jgi:hypothetical protein
MPSILTQKPGFKRNLGKAIEKEMVTKNEEKEVRS